MLFSHPSRSLLAVFAVTLFSFFGSASSKCSNKTYDYIVVGSGPGGGIVASNLALAGHSVLLIEAGRDASDDLSTTVNALYYPQSLDLQWSFFVKHHTDPAAEERYRLLTWTLPDGTFWIGPKTQAPADAKLNGVWYVPCRRACRVQSAARIMLTRGEQVPAWRDARRKCHCQRHGFRPAQRRRLGQDRRVIR